MSCGTAGHKHCRECAGHDTVRKSVVSGRNRNANGARYGVERNTPLRSELAEIGKLPHGGGKCDTGFTMDV